MSKCAVVTGASQGLGLELVKEALKRSYLVFALDLSISKELKSINHDNCITLTCDITDYNAVKHCRSVIEAKTADGIDILFNNAGIWLDNKRLSLCDQEFDFDDVFKQFDVNAVGVLRTVREFAELIMRSYTKTVINLSSEAGSIENCYRNAEYGYCMSKAAQNMASKIMQNSFPNIKFYSVHPGWMKTPQGFKGANESSTPTQDASDTAAKLFDIAEKKIINYQYCDFEGNKIPW